MSDSPQNVTLVVYRWLGNEPGPLAWVFPSVEAARKAVQALRNAAQWLIVQGAAAADVLAGLDISALRQGGYVLAES